jgi:hypothetical protein
MLGFYPTEMYFADCTKQGKIALLLFFIDFWGNHNWLVVTGTMEFYDFPETGGNVRHHPN